MPNSAKRFSSRNSQLLAISNYVQTKPSGLWLCNLLIICPTKSRHAPNERGTSVVSIYIQKILSKQLKYYHSLSLFSQWLQYIFMGIHSTQWLHNRHLMLIAFLRPYMQLDYYSEFVHSNFNY